MVAEMVQDHKELQPRAFSVMPLVWSIGSIFGPAFGGLFANPAVNFPGIFGGNRFFIQFPFALPNLIAGVFFFISITVGILFLKVSASFYKMLLCSPLHCSVLILTDLGNT